MLRQNSLLVLLILLTVGVNLVIADGINTSLSVSAPAGLYYEPGETITATLWMWDDNGDTLYADEAEANGLVNMIIWLAGPNTNYRTMGDYGNITVIQWFNQFDSSAGFDPDSGQISFEIPQDLVNGGTYTLLAKCMRRIGNEYYSDFPRVELVIGQVRPTSSQSLRYLNCNTCHSTPTEHGTNDLANCIVCHNESHNWSFASLMHNEHHEEHINNCTSCHMAGGGVDRYSGMACFTCHHRPSSHNSYGDNMCSGCHTGGNSVYSRHNVPQPNRPGTFSLTTPADGSSIAGQEVTLEWQQANDNDTSDEVTYEVEIATTADFSDVVVVSVGQATSYTLADLIENTEYFWKVLALDRNSEGRYSTDTYTFNTNESGIEENDKKLPTQARISSVFPNPFNAALNVEVEIQGNIPLTLQIYNTSGQRVISSHLGNMNPGKWKSSYDFSDLSSGIYFLQMSSAGTQLDMKKVILIK